MMVEWLVYALVLSGLLSVAAWLGERGVRAQRWPARWVWAGALFGSVALPAWAWLRPALEPTEATPIAAIPGSYVMSSLPPLTVGGGEPTGPSLEAVLAAVWAVASLAVLGLIVLLAVRLHRRRRGWRTDVVEGLEVLVSRDTGPAALGVLRGRVVLPEWALALPADQRRLLIAHEAEHVRARDPQLAFAGLLVAAAMPWNLPLWWQLRRLRLAIEMDCDARVLRAVDDRRGYGALLLEVGQRRTRLALALAEPKSMLERRIRMITMTTGRATARAVGLGALAGLALMVACETPGPTEVASPEGGPLSPAQLLASPGADECRPATYIDARPATRAELEALAPEEIDRVDVLKGAMAVEAARVRAVSGSAISAEEVELRAEGDAAASDGSAECGLILVTTEEASLEERERTRRMIEAATATPPGSRTGGSTLEEIQESPTFTPMTVRPQLRNAAEVQDALTRNYPPLLRDAGIGGTANLWFLIDTEGRVVQTRINQTSGHQALDLAALRVAEVMEFTPAYNRDRRVPVWVALDVSFPQARASEESGTVGGLEGAGSNSAASSSRSAREETEAAPAVLREGVPQMSRDAESGDNGPRFTPMTDRPQLANGAAVSRLLMENYPPLLRDAGIGGTANVWFFIDETGRVAQTRLNRSSGYEELDQAALLVAEQMEFTAALNRGDPVAVWVALDVSFRIQ